MRTDSSLPTPITRPLTSRSTGGAGLMRTPSPDCKFGWLTFRGRQSMIRPCVKPAGGGGARAFATSLGSRSVPVPGLAPTSNATCQDVAGGATGRGRRRAGILETTTRQARSAGRVRGSAVCRKVRYPAAARAQQPAGYRRRVAVATTNPDGKSKTA